MTESSDSTVSESRQHDVQQCYTGTTRLEPDPNIKSILVTGGLGFM